MARFCAKCNVAASNNATFCNKCGDASRKRCSRLSVIYLSIRTGLRPQGLVPATRRIPDWKVRARTSALRGVFYDPLLLCTSLRGRDSGGRRLRRGVQEHRGHRQAGQGPPDGPQLLPLVGGHLLIPLPFIHLGVLIPVLTAMILALANLYNVTVSPRRLLVYFAASCGATTLGQLTFWIVMASIFGWSMPLVAWLVEPVRLRLDVWARRDGHPLHAEIRSSQPH